MLIFTGSSHSINLETLANASSPSSFLPVFWSWRALKAHASSCPLQSSSLSKVLELHSSIPPWQSGAPACTHIRTAKTETSGCCKDLLKLPSLALEVQKSFGHVITACGLPTTPPTVSLLDLNWAKWIFKKKGLSHKKMGWWDCLSPLHTKFLAYLQSVSPKKAKERIDRQYRYLHQTTSIRPICWHTLMQEDLPGYTWSISTKASGQGSPSVSSQLGFHSSSWLFWQPRHIHSCMKST